MWNGCQLPHQRTSARWHRSTSLKTWKVTSKTSIFSWSSSSRTIPMAFLSPEWGSNGCCLLERVKLSLSHYEPMSWNPIYTKEPLSQGADWSINRALCRLRLSTPLSHLTSWRPQRLTEPFDTRHRKSGWLVFDSNRTFANRSSPLSILIHKLIEGYPLSVRLDRVMYWWFLSFPVTLKLGVAVSGSLSASHKLSFTILSPGLSWRHIGKVRRTIAKILWGYEKG